MYSVCCPRCRQWHDGKAHVCLDKTRTELIAELAHVNALLERRNVVIGEMGQEIESLKGSHGP